MGDRCNLECVKGENLREFVGPVKIILVDAPQGAYVRKTYCAAAIVLAQMAMGFATLTVIFYSMSYKKKDWLKALHIFLSTIGVLIPSGVLSLNALNGSAAPMTIRDRQCEHVLLQSVGLLCSLAGMIISIDLNFLNKMNLYDIHLLLGVAANGIFVLCGFTGLFFYKFYGKSMSSESLGSCNRFIYMVHRSLGILGLLAALSCFITGIIKTSFNIWLPLHEMFYVTVMFCIFYILVIIYKPLKELFNF